MTGRAVSALSSGVLSAPVRALRSSVHRLDRGPVGQRALTPDRGFRQGNAAVGVCFPAAGLLSVGCCIRAAVRAVHA
jgi:hypothetical protein